MTHGWWKPVAPPAAVLAGSMLAAEALVRLARVPAWLVPPPSQVVAALWTGRASLGMALGHTAAAAVAGFALSAAVGVLLAVGLSASRWVQRAFYPYAVFFQTVPLVAIAPLLVIWCGNGLQAVVAAAFIVSVFPVIANTLAGLRAVDPALRDLFRLYGAGPAATLVKLRFPAALPQVFTGLRVAAGLAVIGAVVGELFVTGGGLGIAMQTAIKEVRTDQVFAAVLLASLLGLALFGLVSAASYLALRRWHESERDC